jgi:hypothetical protein
MQEHHSLSSIVSRQQACGGGKQLGQVPTHFMLKCFESLNAQILM